MLTAPINSADLLSETVISLPQAARRLPSLRAGRPVSPITVWRWITDGVRLADGSRLRLEGVRIGCRWVTSVEALTRFAARQTPGVQLSASVRTPAARARDDARASADLASRGI